MNIQEEWEHSLQHRQFKLDTTEDINLGDFVNSEDKCYIVIDILNDNLNRLWNGETELRNQIV